MPTQVECEVLKLTYALQVHEYKNINCAKFSSLKQSFVST